MTTAIGQFRHVVSLLQPGAGTPDPDGGWGGDAWDPLDPPTWHCSIQAASLRDLQRLSGGVLSTTATHVLRGRYHPQLTRTARIYFGTRVFDVESVHDQDERRIEVEVIAHEQLGEQAPGPPLVPYPDQVVADGARAYWRLGDLGGTVAVDAVGFAHGTISGGVTLTQPGAVMNNAAMALNGTTGKIVTMATVALPPVCSIEAWIKPAVAKALHPIVSRAGNSPFLCLQDTVVTVYDNENGLAGLGGVEIVIGAWSHVVCVFTGTTLTTYINGIPSAPQAALRTVSTDAALNLGWGSANGTFWNGLLDEVAIYPVALTATQVAAHYAASTGPA
jgi:head-tail adaptor